MGFLQVVIKMPLSRKNSGAPLVFALVRLFSGMQPQVSFQISFSKNAFLQFWIGQQNSLLPWCLLMCTWSRCCLAYDLVHPSNVQLYFLMFRWTSAWF